MNGQPEPPVPRSPPTKPDFTDNSQASRITSHLSHLYAQVHLTSVQAWRNNNRNPSQYMLGFCVIFISIFVILLLLSLVKYTHLIFLNLAESHVGEIDLLVTPNNNVAGVHRFLNYSRIAQLLPDHSFLHSPRFNNYLGVSITNANSCRAWNTDPTYAYLGTKSPPLCDPTSINCLLKLCSQLPASVNFFLLDTERDRRAGIGKSWGFDRIPMGASIVQQDLAENMNVQVGDYVFLNLPWSNLSPYFLDLAINNTRTRFPSFSPPLHAMDSVTIPVRIHAIIPNSLGKLNQATQNLMFMEYDTILHLASEYLHPWYDREFQMELKKLAPRIYDQVPAVMFIRQVPRYLSYFSPEFTTNVLRLLEWASDVRYRLGFTITSASLPILQELQDSQQVSAFINLIMSFIIIILCGLAGFLVYSLLMVSVETKTFELAVFRMVGMYRTTVLLLITVQALSYSIPALIASLSIGQGCFVFLANVLSEFLGVSVSPYLPLDAILIAVMIGILVPILSSILPIRKALTMNLHDALDRNRSSFKRTVVTVDRSFRKFDPLVVLIGFILTVLGFGIYYFLPLALLNNRLELLFNIFLVILLGFVIGLVFLGSNFIQIFQNLFIKFIFTVLFMENRSLIKLVDRNLMAHRVRNRKTSMLYALSLSFIIFLSITTDIEVASLQYSWRRSIGADFKIYSNKFDIDRYPIPISSMWKLEKYASESPLIAGFAFRTWELGSITPDSQGTDISNIGRLDSSSQTVYGVSPGFYDIMGSDYLSVDQYDASIPPFSPSEALYTRKGTDSAVMGAYYQAQYSLTSFDHPFLVTAKYTVSDGGPLGKKSWILYPLFFAKSSPAVFHTIYPGRRQDLLVSLPTFLNLTDGRFESVLELPYQVFFVKLRAGVTNSEYARVKRELRSLLEVEDMVDIQQALRGSNQAASSLAIVFDAVTALVMMIAFFSLNTSFYVNVLEQAKEIGILRALGIRKLAIIRLYFYESLVLVLSSVALGCIIGTIIGWTMAAQRTVLTEIPLSVHFPVRQVLIIGALSVASAFFSTVFPVYMVVYKRSLVQVLED